MSDTRLPLCCVKCQCEDIYVRWHRGNKGDWPGRVCSLTDFSKPSGEHLHHYCRTCGYDWFEDVADA